MHGHKTWRGLDDPLPSVLGPAWHELAGIASGAGVLWALSQLTAPLRLGPHGILLSALPAVAVSWGILALYQGRSERYLQQVVRYTGRRVARTAWYAVLLSKDRTQSILHAAAAFRRRAGPLLTSPADRRHAVIRWLKEWRSWIWIDG